MRIRDIIFTLKSVTEKIGCLFEDETFALCLESYYRIRHYF